MMGQRAALMDAFRLAMPAQQQMGSMSSGLQRLQAQVRARSLFSCPGRRTFLAHVSGCPTVLRMLLFYFWPSEDTMLAACLLHKEAACRCSDFLQCTCDGAFVVWQLSLPEDIFPGT